MQTPSRSYSSYLWPDTTTTTTTISAALQPQLPRAFDLTTTMAPQQPTARGIRIRNAHDAQLLFYAVVRSLFSPLAIPNSSPFLFEQVSERRHCPSVELQHSFSLLTYPFTFSYPTRFSSSRCFTRSMLTNSSSFSFPSYDSHLCYNTRPNRFFITRRSPAG